MSNNTPPAIGIKGSITFNGQSYDFHNTIDLLPSTTTTFPPSEGPRSIVNGADEVQKAKYINAYDNTDRYLTALRATKVANNDTSSQSDQLCLMTHCFTRTRQETDHVLTMLMTNGALPAKRKLQADAGEEDHTAQGGAKKTTGLTREELEQVSEEIKRQRALDTTEYFSHDSSSDGEGVVGQEMTNGGGDDNEEQVGLLDQPAHQDGALGMKD